MEGFRLFDQGGVENFFGTPFGGNYGARIDILGPIIGFRVLTRTIGYLGFTDNYDGVPIYMSVLYNSCACPQSQFIADSAPFDMTAQAVQSP